jgi:hypothetical protein
MRGNSVVIKYELENVSITSHAMKEGKEHISISFENMKILHPASRREAAINVSG